MMNKPAFLVDGHLEQKFIKKACPGKPVKRLNCNGKDVAAIAIAKRIATLCRLFGGRYSPIIVWVDRECRKESHSLFASQILQAVKNEGINDTVILGVADRTVENWILSDEQTVRQEYPISGDYPLNPDGFHGKNELKKLIDGYHETTIGSDLLLKCYASRMTLSDSFKNFYIQLPKDGCWWLER